ncbi:MAG: glucose-6-phosphate isomerase [Planctomycetota bacterium]
MTLDRTRLTAQAAEFQRWRCTLDDPPIEVDFAMSGLDQARIDASEPGLRAALAAMQALEAGATANADEQRMVGHYWLRAPGRAPRPEIGDEIGETLQRIEDFARRVHAGDLAPAGAKRFAKLLLIGIGGSALGPMLAADALGCAALSFHILDNTDPDGIDRVLAAVGSLHDALCVVVSKSGGTPETRNGMLEVMAACERQGVGFAPRAIAVTTEGSTLHRRASAEQWLETFPIWDWVGGRTSITSAVGLLPMALLGADVRAFLAGAAAMDQATRSCEPARNPAALMAAFWWHEGGGEGRRAMVVLPYKDRLLLLSRYLQQLVMESLGKRLDRQGHVVEQGLSVYGNKGSTDQHAYVQQLRDGRHDFFAVFVRVLRDREGPSASMVEDEPRGPTAGAYLDGFLLGTRAALYENGRHSATLTLDRVDERSLGALVALFERAVGIYGELIDVNAYHQPGVEAGKKAAQKVLDLAAQVQRAVTGDAKTSATIAAEADADPHLVWCILQHLAANPTSIRRIGAPDPATATFVRT